MMDYNVNFKGRLNVDGITTNKSRWKNIAKIFKEETKGINYESKVFDDTKVLEVFVDRFERKNRHKDFFDELETREAILTEKGTKELLSLPDAAVANILAAHLKFVQKLDNSWKLAEKTMDDAYDKVAKIFMKNGFKPELMKNIFDNIYSYELGNLRVEPEYKALRELPGFKDAEISHVDYLD